MTRVAPLHLAEFSLRPQVTQNSRTWHKKDHLKLHAHAGGKFFSSSSEMRTSKDKMKQKIKDHKVMYFLVKWYYYVSEWL